MEHTRLEHVLRVPIFVVFSTFPTSSISKGGKIGGKSQEHVFTDFFLFLLTDFEALQAEPPVFFHRSVPGYI